LDPEPVNVCGLLQVAGDLNDTWRAPLTQRLLELRSARERLEQVLTTQHTAPAAGTGPWNNPAQGGWRFVPARRGAALPDACACTASADTVAGTSNLGCINMQSMLGHVIVV
jgi:hypothetical protein